MQPMILSIEYQMPVTGYIFAVMYGLLRQLLFNFDPEQVHYFSMNALRKAAAVPVTKHFIAKQFAVQHPSLEKELFGLKFKNPVGLGAGFDKNAVYLSELEMLGFGSVEIGTVTPKPQPGNPQPRLFRLKEDQALINRMGFNNNGVKAVRGRLENWKKNNSSSTLIVGGNIGKNKDTANEDAWKDYNIGFTELCETADYFVVNVSSPNTVGLRALQEKDALLKILSEIQNINHGKQKPKPLLLKIAPDLTEEQLNDIIELSSTVKLDGLVATNTTIQRSDLKTAKQKIESIGNGGLSGKPVFEISTSVVKYIAAQTNGSIPIIGSGGIFTGKDAAEKMDAGAELVQVWTGFIYEGPSIVKNICNYLVEQNR
jgi:dihydroorotate dehydrogenase